MEKRHVSGEPVQALSTGPLPGMFTAGQRLHLCLSASLLVKALQASVLPPDTVGDDDPPHVASAATDSLYLRLLLLLMYQMLLLVPDSRGDAETFR